MIYNKNLQFEETKEIMKTFFKEESYLKYTLTEKVHNLEILINIIIEKIEYALKNPENPYFEEQQLKNGDMQRLTYINYILPSLYLSDEYDNLYDFLSAYILLLNNYNIIYEANTTDDFKQSLFALNNLMEIQSNFTRLIQISNILISKYENAKEINDSPFSISKIYLHSLLNENEEAE